MNLSVYLITLNEENRLENTLKAAAKVADEIVMVDSGSTDKTVEIAKKYKARIFYHEWKSYCDQKSFAEKKCSSNWVLMLDADEVLSDGLIAEIKQIKKNPTADAYKIKICNMFPGDKKPRVFAQSFNAVRLYNRDCAYMPPDLWNKDRVKVRNPKNVSQLKNKIYHYCFLSLEQATAKYNLHGSELVHTVVAEKRTFSRLRLYTEFPRQFLRYYFLKRYFLLGTQGFIQAMVLAHFRFLKIAKWFEYQSLHKK